jgi:hypothetical protein
LNTERKTALIACTLFFALYALLNYFQFTELRQLERNAFLSKLQNQVPVIQKNAQVQQLAIRKALNITAGPSTLNRNNKEVKENLLGKFKGIKLILWDKTLERIIADGFSLKEITSWQYMMKDYFRSYVNSETAMKESFKVHSTFEEKLKFRFRQSQFPNFLNFAGLKFEGKDGILLLGLISKWPENQKSIVQETAIASKPKEFSKNLRRGLVIFIPSSAYDNYEWFSRNFSQVIDNNDLIMAQEQQIIEKLKAGYKNGRKLAKKFISARRTSLNGAITHQDQGFIFCQTSLKMPGQKSSLVALLPFTRKDKEFYPGLLINQVFLIAGLLLIFMLFTKRIPTNFSKNISRQFIILLAAACIIPFSELCRQFFIHRKSESLKSAANIFNKLEERLEICLTTFMGWVAQADYRKKQI